MISNKQTKFTGKRFFVQFLSVTSRSVLRWSLETISVLNKIFTGPTSGGLIVHIRRGQDYYSPWGHDRMYFYIPDSQIWDYQLPHVDYPHCTNTHRCFQIPHPGGEKQPTNTYTNSPQTHTQAHSNTKYSQREILYTYSSTYKHKTLMEGNALHKHKTLTEKKYITNIKQQQKN